MGASKPKQFIELKGKPILQYTIERFRAYDDTIKMIVVLPMHDIQTWKRICEEKGYAIDYDIAVGGNERFHSIKQGLQFCDKGALVAIHDGVRPFVSSEVIANCFDAAEKEGAALPVMRITETIREITQDGSKHANRDRFVIVQTPQIFKTDLIKAAYRQEYIDSFTDDASVLESMGHKVHLIDGNPENIKITKPEDLEMAEWLLGKLF